MAAVLRLSVRRRRALLEWRSSTALHCRNRSDIIRSRSIILAVTASCIVAALGVTVFGSSDGLEDWADVAYGENADGEPFDSQSLLAGEDSAHVLDPSMEAAEEDRSTALVADGGDRPARPPTVVDLAAGFEVRVIEKATGAAVPGAKVFYFDTLSPNYRAFRRFNRQYQADKELALRAAGEVVVADESGVAILPYGIPAQAVTVRHENLYNELRVSGRPREGPAREYIVALERDRTIEVRVVDTEGEPVTGVHLAFYIAVRQGDGPARWVLWRDPHRDTKSPDGIQRLPHVQRSVALLSQLSGTEPIFHIGLDVPGLTRCGPTMLLTDLPDEPIEVVLSELGKVRVRVLDADGEPVRGRVRLTAPPDFSYPDLIGRPEELANLCPKWERETDGSGYAVFDQVALTENFRVECLGADMGDGVRADIAGPVNPGQVIEVELTRAFTAAVIEGVALNARGEVLRGTSLSYQASSRWGTRTTEYLNRGVVATDQDGVYRIRLAPTKTLPAQTEKAGNENTRNRPPSGSQPRRANLYSHLTLGLRNKDAVRATAKVPLPERLEAARYTVGPAKLRPPALIASGRVFLDDEPIRFFDRFIIDWRNPDNKNRWERVSDVFVHGRRGGSFEVRGDLKDRALRLRARSWGYLPVESVMLANGQRNLEFRLYSAGSLRSLVLHDEAAADAQMEVLLVPEKIDYPEVSDALKWQFVGRVDKRGSGKQGLRRAYWWTGLPPGTYRLELRMLGAPRPFVVLSNLQPTFGRRLDAVPMEVINLRGQIERVKVRAVDAKNRPVYGMVFPAGGAALGTQEGLKMGRRGAVLHAATTGPARGVDLQVVAKGYRTETLQGVSGERVVRMRPGIPVAVGILAPRLPKGVALVATIRRTSYDYSRLYKQALRNPVNTRAGSQPLSVLMGERSVRLRYRGKRQWKATLMEHGTFDLLIELRKKGKDPVRLTGFSPSRLVVRDTSTEHEFAVALDPGLIAAGLTQLGETPVLERTRGKNTKKPKKANKR